MNKQVTNFEYLRYELSERNTRVDFTYRFNFSDGSALDFSEKVVFSKSLMRDGLPTGLMHKALEATHIMLGVSYYKLYCPHEVVVPYELSDMEADFWTKLHRQGLGEFYYRNKLNPLNSPDFVASKSQISNPVRLPGLSGALVGIGGGKDSIVACEILKKAGLDVTGFVVPQTEKTMRIIQDSMNTIGIGSVEVHRTIDPKIREKFDGVYNGHVPISGVFAFLGLLAALVEGFRYVVVGNEQSSNIGNAEISGVVINHQWSKSTEFEQLFQSYVHSSLTKDLTYFSVLRPFSELRIVEIFTRYPKYFKHFTSCNRNFRQESNEQTLWCGECPKCLFIFILLSAFLKKEELIGIYGKNLFEDEKLLPLFRDILGIGGMKPFDCVGTFEEAKVAFEMAKSEYVGSFVVEKLKSEMVVTKSDMEAAFKTATETDVPDYLRFAGLDSALVLGYEVEGKATQRYLQRAYPDIKVGIADQKDGANYLKQQAKYDIVVKTPGIPVSKVTAYHTTAANIFFSSVRGKTIGVTGTKGKSTVSSLIYEILLTAGKKAELVGNIGQPMLDALVRDSEETVYVVELSSYQLEDIRYSPDIAVVLNLYQDHMSYHGSLERYHSAKMNIIKYQNAADIVFYNSGDKLLASKLKDADSKKVPIENGEYKAKLLGTHNQFNINAAATVAKSLGVSDEVIIKTVADFAGLEHRLEFVAEKGGVKFYDDAISTTPESTIAAISCFDNIGSLILGGTDRGYDYAELEQVIHDKGIKNVVLFPDSGRRIFTNRTGMNILETTNTEEAVRFCLESSDAGVCLMSPAAPSFSCFKNYKDRGDQFKAAVREL